MVGRTMWPTEHRWSYDLLDATKQVLFGRLAVCVGGCTVETIQALCGGEVLDSVESLVEKCLVLQELGLAGEPRVRIGET